MAWCTLGAEPGTEALLQHPRRPTVTGEGSWLEWSWTALETWIKARMAPAALVPVGAIEQHGPFLPLGTDLIITEHIAESIAGQVDLMTVPAFGVSASDTHLGFPGTLSVGGTMLSEVLKRLCLQLQGRDDLGRKHAKAGFDNVFLLSAHGGNVSTLREVAKLDGVRALPGWWELPEVREAIHRLGIVEGTHADDTETSLLLYYGYAIALPELPFKLPEGSNDSNLDRPDTRAISASGILAPGLYSPSAEFGRALHEAAVCGYVKVLEADGVRRRAPASGSDDHPG